MRASTLDSVKRVVDATWAVSLSGARRRLRLGILELMPQLLFYLAQAVIIFVIFGHIGGHAITRIDLAIFVLIVASVDSLGDALIFKGLSEYTACLRRGQVIHYLLAPGPALAKVLFLRWDLPMMGLGAVAGMAATVTGFAAHGPQAFALLPLIALGTLVHAVLTAAFHIIQAHFDPTMPISFGSPAARLYTKPIHFLAQGGAAATLITCFYPAYMITALPASVATFGIVNAVERAGSLPLAMAVASWIMWALGLNFLVGVTCRRRQG